MLIPPPSCCYQESGGVRLLNDHHLLCWPISISPPFFSQLVTDLLGAELASHARGEIDDCAAKRSDCDRWSPWQPPFENIYLFQSNIMTLSRVWLFKKEQPTAVDPAKIIVDIRPVAAHHWAAPRVTRHRRQSTRNVSLRLCLRCILCALNNGRPVAHAS